MSRLILVTGGARSGKSDFAQRLAQQIAGDDVTFVATAEAGDDDMTRRIAAHRLSRPAAWDTVEAPRNVDIAFASLRRSVIVIDCLTLLVSNVLLAAGEEAVDCEVRSLRDAIRLSPSTVLVVTNEVGLGIVPDNQLARQYRDRLGRANAAFAEDATAVYFLISGLAIDVKAIAVKGSTP